MHEKAICLQEKLQKTFIKCFPTYRFSAKERLKERIEFLEEKNRNLEQIIGYKVDNLLKKKYKKEAYQIFKTTHQPDIDNLIKELTPKYRHEIVDKITQLRSL